VDSIKRFGILFIILLIFSLSAKAEDIILEPSGNAEDIIALTSFADYDKLLNPAQAENFVALGLMYQSTSGFFLPNDTLSNALALRLVLRTIGKEAEADALAYNADERKLAGLKEYDDMSWADGYYIYALKNGIINRADLDDAYNNPDSPLARDRSVSAQNLIKWMTIAHKVILVNSSLPTNAYLDNAYKPYYASLYKYGFFTAADVEYFAPYRYITRDDVALLLEKFETYILSTLKIRSAIGKVTGIGIKFSDENYVRSINCFASGQDFTIISKGKNIASPTAGISGETVVLGKGQPDISGVLRNGDKVKIYYKDNEVLFIRVMDYEEKEEYRPSPRNFSGKLYLYDYTTRKITLKSDDNKFVTFYASENMRSYHKTSEIDASDLLLDSVCNIYLDAPIRGGLLRVYSIITN